MTEAEATHDAITLSNVDDLLTKAHELAVSARKRAADEGLHEHYRDQVYLNAVQVALMELRPCTCEKCMPVSAKRSYWWLASAAICLYFFASSVYWAWHEVVTVNRVLDIGGILIWGFGVCMSLILFWKRVPWRKL